MTLSRKGALKYVAYGLLCYSASHLAGYLEDLEPAPNVDNQSRVVDNQDSVELQSMSSGVQASAATSTTNSSRREVKEYPTKMPQVITVDEPIEVHSPKETTIQVYYLPSETKVDPVPQQRVMAAFSKGEDAGRTAVLNATSCGITSQIIIRRNNLWKESSSSCGTWSLSTLDSQGRDKRMGGDEFYITFTVEEDTQPAAIANITDMNNGTYCLNFVRPPTETVATATTVGTLKVILEQSCHMGSLSPPLKQHWKTSGAINQIYTIHNVPAPKLIQPFVPPNLQGTIDFGQFDQIVFLGDSLMGQMACPDPRLPDPLRCATFHPNIFRGRQVESALNLQTLDSFLRQARLDLLEAKQIARGKYDQPKPPRDRRRSSPRLGLLIGSGVWDVLAADGEDANFANHLEACRQLILALQQEHPKVTIFWKSMAALHIHQVATNADWMHMRRTYYMSHARAKRLHQLQKALMRELEVPIVDVFEATYLAAHATKQGDGRHFLPSFNELLLSWFYPNQTQSREA